MRLPHLQKGVVGVAGLAVCQNDQGLAEFLESFGVDFGDEAAGELGVGAADRLLCRGIVDLEDVVVVYLVLCDPAAEAVAKGTDESQRSHAVH